jgi:hypothetical protein
MYTLVEDAHWVEMALQQGLVGRSTEMDSKASSRIFKFMTEISSALDLQCSMLHGQGKCRRRIIPGYMLRTFVLFWTSPTYG